jgi:hypothetical protein
MHLHLQSLDLLENLYALLMESISNENPHRNLLHPLYSDILDRILHMLGRSMLEGKLIINPNFEVQSC